MPDRQGEQFVQSPKALSRTAQPPTLVEPNPVDARLARRHAGRRLTTLRPRRQTGSAQGSRSSGTTVFQIRARLPGPRRWVAALAADRPAQADRRHRQGAQSTGIPPGRHGRERAAWASSSWRRRRNSIPRAARSLPPDGSTFRGMLGVGDDIPGQGPGILGCRLDTPVDFPRGPAEELLREAFPRRSSVRALIARRQRRFESP